MAEIVELCPHCHQPMPKAAMTGISGKSARLPLCEVCTTPTPAALLQFGHLRCWKHRVKPKPPQRVLGGPHVNNDRAS